MDDDLNLVVDTESLLLCRLCLLEKGKFQISQAMQRTVKLLFTIDINSYDGMSQIMCGGCKAIISEMSTIKDTFLQNQQLLLLRKQKIADNETDLPPIGAVVTSSTSNGTSQGVANQVVTTSSISGESPATSTNDSVSTAMHTDYSQMDNTDVEEVTQPEEVDRKDIIPLLPCTQDVQTNVLPSINQVVSRRDPTPKTYLKQSRKKRPLLKAKKNKVSKERLKQIPETENYVNDNMDHSGDFDNSVDFEDFEEHHNSLNNLLSDPESKGLIERINENLKDSGESKGITIKKENDSNFPDVVSNLQSIEDPPAPIPNPPRVSMHYSGSTNTESQSRVAENPPVVNPPRVALHESPLSNSLTNAYPTRSTRNTAKYNCFFCVKVTLDGSQLQRHIHTHHSGLLNKLKALTVPCSVRMKNISSSTLAPDWVHIDSNKVYQYNPKDMYFFKSKQNKSYTSKFFDTSSEGEEGTDDDDQPFKNYTKINQRSRRVYSSSSRRKYVAGSASSVSSYRDADEDSRFSTDSYTSTTQKDPKPGNQVSENVPTPADTPTEWDDTEVLITETEIRESMSQLIMDDSNMPIESLHGLLASCGLVNACWVNSTSSPQTVSVSFSNELTDEQKHPTVVMNSMLSYKERLRNVTSLGHLKLLQPPPDVIDDIIAGKTVTSNVETPVTSEITPVIVSCSSLASEQAESKPVVEKENDESETLYSCIDIKPEIKQEVDVDQDNAFESICPAKPPFLNITDDKPSDLPMLKLKKVLKEQDITLVFCETPNRIMKLLMRLTLRLLVNDRYEDFFLDLFLRDDFVFVLLVSTPKRKVIDVSNWSEDMHVNVLKSIKCPKFLNSLTALAPKFGKFSGPLMKLKDTFENFE